MQPRLFTFKRHTLRLIQGALILFAFLLATGSREITTLESVRERGELRMATRVGPLTYYLDGRGPNGFEYVLASRFAESLGVELKVNATDTLAKLYNMLGGPNADFIAASLTVTPQRQQRFLFSDSYADVVQTVIYKRGTARPRNLDDLAGKRVVVISDSSHEEHLRERLPEYPDLQWESIGNVEMVELIEMVHNGTADFAIVDSTSYNAHKAMYPRARAAFDLTQPQPLAWAFARQGDRSLVNAANRYINMLRENGELDQLRQRFFTGIQDFSVGHSIRFYRLMQERLPEYEPLFREVANEFGLDWHLIAAIAYQESHWNPDAVSPTGVRGLMMLTRAAASEVGVDNRRDAEQSLRGGVEYLLDIKSRLPDSIIESDRTWFALAAYNVGMGHLEDARVLTERAGRSPNHWQDVREHLPLLQKKQYYSTVRHGYARGGEPVIYVQNIRKYMRILQWNTLEANRRERRNGPALPDSPVPWGPRSFLTL